MGFKISRPHERGSESTGVSEAPPQDSVESTPATELSGRVPNGDCYRSAPLPGDRSRVDSNPHTIALESDPSHRERVLERTLYLNGNRGVGRIDVPHPRIHLDEVRPGDIMCVFVPAHHRHEHHPNPGFDPDRADARKKVRVGQRYLSEGVPSLVHHCVVVGKEDGKLLIAEASLHVGHVTISKLDPQDNIEGENKYLFYRLRDPSVAQRVADIAREWGRSGIQKFSKAKILATPLRSSHPGLVGRSRLTALAQHVISGTKPTHSVYCAQFVASVCAAAEITSHIDCERTTVTPDDLEPLLRRKSPGAARHPFAIDPGCITSAKLHKRILDNAAGENPDVEVVGYISTPHPDRSNES